MNIAAHALWGVALTPKSKANELKWAVFWSVFSDLIWLIFLLPYLILVGAIPDDFSSSPWWFYHLYGLGHSMVVWGIINFVLVALRKWRWYLLFWLFHILVDIPGHIRFATPFLYPLSSLRLNGWFSWDNYAIWTVSLLVPMVLIALRYRLVARKIDK